MAIKTTLSALSTTRAAVFTPTTGSLQDPTPILIQNPDAAINIFLGGPTVTNTGAATGILISPGQIITMSLTNGDILYAIAASGTPNIVVMAGRQ